MRTAGMGLVLLIAAFLSIECRAADDEYVGTQRPFANPESSRR